MWNNNNNKKNNYKYIINNLNNKNNNAKNINWRNIKYDSTSRIKFIIKYKVNRITIRIIRKWKKIIKAVIRKNTKKLYL